MKNVLILYKTSAYKHYFLNKKKSPRYVSLRSNIISRFKKTHEQHYQALKKIEEYLKSKNIRYRKIKRGLKADYSQADFIITVGGDGTFLEAAHHVNRQLILGVNSDPRWSVGRFCSADANNFREVLDRILDKNLKILLIQRLTLKFLQLNRRVNVLNEILVCHKNPAAMSRYYITIEGKKEEQRSSGLWIATAAGSTGAIHSAGGGVFSLKSSRFQYRPRELYLGYSDYHHLGGVLSSHQKIHIISLMRDGVVYADGAHLKFPLGFGEKLTVGKSSQPLKVVYV